MQTIAMWPSERQSDKRNWASVLFFSEVCALSDVVRLKLYPISLPFYLFFINFKISF